MAALTRSTLMAVRRVLHAHREGWVLDDRLTAAARMIAEDARREDLPAAGMLVALKHAWTALDEVRQGPPLDMQELLSRLVSRSIASYYDRSPSSRHAGQPHADTGARSAA